MDDLLFAHREDEPEVALDRNGAATRKGRLTNLDEDLISCVEELHSGRSPVLKALGPVRRRLEEPFLA